MEFKIFEIDKRQFEEVAFWPSGESCMLLRARTEMSEEAIKPEKDE